MEFDQKSITLDEYREKYKPLLNSVADLVLSHSDIPEDVSQSDLLGALTTLATELENGLTGRIPEFVKVQEELAKKNKQVQKLQETNQQLFLRVGNYQNPTAKPGEDLEPPRKSFQEIGKMLESL